MVKKIEELYEGVDSNDEIKYRRWIQTKRMFQGEEKVVWLHEDHRISASAILKLIEKDCLDVLPHFERAIHQYRARKALLRPGTVQLWMDFAEN